MWWRSGRTCDSNEEGCETVSVCRRYAVSMRQLHQVSTVCGTVAWMEGACKHVRQKMCVDRETEHQVNANGLLVFSENYCQLASRR